MGNLLVNKYWAAATNSGSHGYIAGFYDRINIEKFSFASNGNTTNVGNLTVMRGATGGMTETNYGYTAGGYTYPPYVESTIIDRYSFASDGNATSVGDLVSGEGGRYGKGWQV